MRNYYLVDLENVKNSGLDGIEQLAADDRVIVFYSDKADTLKIDVIQKIKEGKAAVTFIKADNGTPNSLDFQLITYLYYHLAKDESDDGGSQYWIISKDTGYEASIRMAKKMGLMTVRRAPAILNAVHYQVRAGKSSVQAETKEKPAEESYVYQDADAPEEAEEMPDETAYAVLNQDQSDAAAVFEKKEEPQEEIKKNEEHLETGSQEDTFHAIQQLLHEKCNVDVDQNMMSLVEKALENSENKNQFYQYFRRHMGAQEGSRFYKSIRGQYTALKEIAGA